MVILLLSTWTLQFTLPMHSEMLIKGRSVLQSASCLWFGDSDSECKDLEIVSAVTISDTFY